MRKNTYLLAIFVLLIFLTACSNNKITPNERFETYINEWNNEEFTTMYDMISASSRETYQPEDFIDRYHKVYEDFDVTNLKVTYEALNEEVLKEAIENKTATLPLSVKMETVAGPIEFDYEATLILEGEKKEQDWFVQWDPGFIFPEIKDGGEIRFQTESPRRGEILDRNKMPLAMNDQVYEVGIVPEKMGELSAQAKERLAQLLHMSVEAIDDELAADWVQPDLFVPLKKIPKTKSNVLNELWQLNGVTSREVVGRIYPAGKATSHLVGYIGQITSEELANQEPGTYNATDLIGKRGIEQLFEDQLKGESGLQIIVSKEGEKDVVLAERPVKNGENIELTIDINVQERIYESYNNEAGTAAAIDPKTGETIALVSSPGFDSNEMLYGMSDTAWNNLQSDPKTPLINRFAATYAPGSVIKPITAAIGLDNGTIDPKEALQIEGLTWGNGKGWGDYKVRRVSSTGKPVDLADAMIRSDNIYFAMQAVKMGNEKFIKGLHDFGFEEDFPFIYPFRNSSISATGTLDGEVPLANTSYGQAQVEMSSLHLALAYSSFLNDGKMMKPTLLLSEDTKEVWHEQLVTPEHAKLIRSQLKDVVMRGTAKAAKRESIAVSGKTGTAELKLSSDSKGHENGWFVGYPTDSQDIVLALMVEHAENIGTSSLAAKTVADILEDIEN